MAEADTTIPPAEAPAEEPAKKTNHLLETPSDSPDPDEVELQAALKAVEEEGKQTPDPETPVTPEPPPPAVQQPAAEPPAGHVPVAVVQDERAKRQEAENVARQATASALYYKGVAEGKFPSPNVVGTPRPAQDSPDQARVKQIRSEMKGLASQVDAGTLSVAEYEEKRSGLEDQIADIRDARIIDQAKAAGGNDLYLGTITAKLEEANPWVHNIPQAELLDLKPGAIRDLVQAGVDYQAIAGTPMGDYRLREAIVSRAKRRGLDVEFGGQQQQPAPQAPAVTAKPTQAQVDDKTRLAATAPPRPEGTNAPVNAWTQERVEAMDPVDFENLSMKDLKAVGDLIDRQQAATRVTTPTRR